MGIMEDPKLQEWLENSKILERVANDATIVQWQDALILKRLSEVYWEKAKRYIDEHLDEPCM